MSFAKEMRQMATELLTDFDERIVKAKLIVVTEGAWNPAIGENNPQTTEQKDLTGVAASYSKSLINETTIQSGDVKFISTFEPAPTQADKVLLDGFEWSIVNVDPIAYTGIDKVIAYNIQLRR